MSSVVCHWYSADTLSRFWWLSMRWGWEISSNLSVSSVSWHPLLVFNAPCSPLPFSVPCRTDCDGRLASTPNTYGSGIGRQLPRISRFYCMCTPSNVPHPRRWRLDRDVMDQEHYGAKLNHSWSWPHVYSPRHCWSSCSGSRSCTLNLGKWLLLFPLHSDFIPQMGNFPRCRC